MPNTSGKYSVPEEIRRLKPRGTMVKKINGHFYVYGMKNTKDPTTGKWKTVTTGILGKITLEDGYVPNEDAGYTVLEYGAYHWPRSVPPASGRSSARRSARAKTPGRSGPWP